MEMKEKSLNKFCWFVQRNREISTKGISEREVFIKRGCVLIKEKRGGRKGSDIGGHMEGEGVHGRF